MLLPNKKRIRYEIEAGFIILNSTQNRDEYIKSVFRTNRVTVITSFETVYNDCPILFGYSERISFPEKIGELGSSVLLGFPRGVSKPVVLGIIPTKEKSDNANLTNEFQDEKIYESDECVISVNKNPKDGEFNICIFGKKAGNSNLNIIAGSVDEDALLNIYSSGNVNIGAVKTITLNVNEEFLLNVRNKNTQEDFSKISYKLGTGFVLEDEFKNKIITKSDGSIIETPKIKIGKDETVKKILTDLIDAILAMTLKHPQGPTIPQGVINQSQFEGIKSRIEKFMEIS